MNIKSSASNYQYKVLDPKYNPQAQELLEGKLNLPEYNDTKRNKNFDPATFFALFALIIFPILVISIAMKTFKRMAHLTNESEQKIGNIKIESYSKNENSEDIVSELFSLIDKDEDEIISTKIEKGPFSDIKSQAKLAYHSAPIKAPEPVIASTISSTAILEKNTEEAQNKTQPINEITDEKAKELINKYFSSSIEKIPNPVLLHTSLLSSNKGLCVVEYNKKYSLIGYINNEIFFLEQFENIKNSEIRSRLTETKDATDRYIIKVGEHKSLVEVNEKEMKMVLEL